MCMNHLSWKDITRSRTEISEEHFIPIFAFVNDTQVVSYADNISGSLRLGFLPPGSCAGSFPQNLYHTLNSRSLSASIILLGIYSFFALEILM